MLSIGNKKYRNLQEQVGYNTKCIQELAEAIDGITLEDKLVIIANDSGTFTDEEMTVLNGPLAFISDGSKVWLKQSETPTEFVFKAIDIVATEVGGTHYNVGGSKIVVTRATRAYVTSDDVIITTYDKTQIDSIVSGINSTKADKTNIPFENIKDEHGKNRFVEGNVTLNAISGVTQTYGKWSLSGSHLMIVIAGSMEANTAIAGDTYMCPINVPQWVIDKLYPIRASYICFIDGVVSNTDWSFTTIPVGLQKSTSDLRLYKVGSTTFTKANSFRITIDLLVDND